MIRITLQAFCIFLFLATSTTQASPVVLDFGDSDPINFEHDTILSSQYSESEFGGASISAENESKGPDLAVSLDSRLNNTESPDLGASIWLFATALLGFVGLSRRTSV